MRRYAFLAGLLCIVPACIMSCSQASFTIQERVVAIPVGESSVNVVIHTAGSGRPAYVSLHDDENTAVDATLEVLRRLGGTLYEIQHRGRRLITFGLGEGRYRFDPNRIFSEAGAEKTVRESGPYAPEAVAAVRLFASNLLDIVRPDSGRYLITVHNNTQGEFSVLSYVQDGPYAGDAMFVHVADGMDPDDFFFVTDVDAYTEIRSGDYNVVLQNNDTVVDDGSLSVYAAREGIPYINVEARHGHRPQQARMLEFLNEHILPGD